MTADAIPPVTMVLIDMEGVNLLDLQSADMLNELAENMKGAGVEIHLARVKYEVMKMIEKDGVDRTVGRDHIHNKVVEAVQWFHENHKPDFANKP